LKRSSAGLLHEPLHRTVGAFSSTEGSRAPSRPERLALENLNLAAQRQHFTLKVRLMTPLAAYTTNPYKKIETKLVGGRPRIRR
jgi:hypothetical protein